MTASNLDRLLLARYGNRTLNELAKMYANNMGVIEDVTELSELVKQYYWDEWMKINEALMIEYDAIKPMNITSSMNQSDSGVEVREKSNDRTINENTSTTDTTTRNLTDTETRNLSKSESLGGEDILTRTSTNTGNETTTLSGSDSTETNRNSSEIISTASTYTADPEHNKVVENSSVNSSDEHNITKNEATISGKTYTDNLNRVAPYDTNNQKEINSSESLTTNTNKTESSLTEDNSSNTTNNSTTTKEINELKNDNTTGSNEVDEDVTVQYGKVETTNTSDNISESDKNQYGKTSSTTDTGTLTNTNTGTLTEENLKTGEIEDNLTSNENNSTTLERLITLNKSGNIGNITNQQLILEEISLRRKNFYDMIVRDVAGLLTINVYA